MTAATEAGRASVRGRAARGVSSRPFARYLALTVAASLAAFAAFYAASVWLVTTQVRPHDTLYRSLALLRQTGSRGAAFGDSHAAVDFIGDASFLNLAYPSEGIADMAERLDRYLRRTPHPRRLLIEADVQLFSAYRLAAPKEGYFDDSPRRWIIGERDRGYLLRYWRVFLRRGAIASDQTMAANGWLDESQRFDLSPPNERRAATEDRVRLHAPAPPARAAEARAAYEAMLRQAAAAGAAVCVVSFPGSRDYMEGVRALPGAAAVYDFFRDAAGRYGLRYVDLSRRFEGAGDLRYFSDADHLDEEGARMIYPEIMQRCFDEMSQS